MTALGILVAVLAGAGLEATAQSATQVHILEYQDDALVDRVRACDSVLKKGLLREGVELAQQVMDSCTTSGTAGGPRYFPLVQDTQSKRLWLSAPLHLSRTLSSLQKEGRDLHEHLYGKLAEANRKAAIQSQDRARLQTLIDRFPTTQAGRQARLTLARIALESGEVHQSNRHLLDWIHERPATNPRQPVPGNVLGALALALRASGDSASLAKIPADDRSLLIAGKKMTLRGFVEAERARLQVEDFTFPLSQSDTEPTWQQIDNQKTGEGQATILSHSIILRLQKDRLLARDIGSGKLLWARETGDDSQPLPQENNPLTRSGLAVGSGVCVLVRQPSKNRRVLMALDTQTGDTLWSLTSRQKKPDEKVETDVSHLLWSSQAIIEGDTVYIGAHDGATQPRSWLVALDLSTGTVRWMTCFGHGVPLPYETASGQLPGEEQWVTCSAPAHTAGLILITDNLGTIAAVEAQRGYPRWVYRYERRKAVDTSRFGQSSLRRGWRRSRIFVDGDRFIVNPEDSDEALCFFTNPSPVADRPVSHVNFVLNDVLDRNGLSQVLGFQEGVVYLAGRNQLEDIDVVEAWTPAGEDRLHQWPSPAPVDTPVAGALFMGENSLYISTASYVYHINRSSGAVSDPVIAREASPGRFLGDLFLTEQGLLTAAPAGLCFWKNGK